MNIPGTKKHDALYRTIGLLTAALLWQSGCNGKNSDRPISPKILFEANEHYLMGKSYEAVQNYALACPEYEQAAKLNPRMGKALLCLGVCAMQKDLTSQALQYFQKALSVDINPGDAAIAHHDIGAVLAKHGKLEQAISEFRVALILNPSFAQAKSALDQTLYRQNPNSTACVAASSADLKKGIDEDSKIRISTEITFRDLGGRHGKAVFRSYTATHLSFDVLLHRPDGTINRIMPLDDSPTYKDYGEDPRIISLEPDHDSIYMAYPPLMVSGRGMSLNTWYTILDPSSCEWVGMLVSYDGIGSPTINWTENHSNPRFEKEVSYLKKVKKFGE